MLIQDAKRRLRQWLDLHQAHVMLISPPGSGRTWLSAMISRYYHLTAGAPADRLIKQRSFYRGLRNVPRFYLVHPSQIWGSLDPVRAARLHRGKRTIFLVREPRDAAITQVFHRNFRSDRPAGQSLGVGVNEQRPYRDLAQYHGKLNGVLESLARIEAVAALLPEHLLTTYEGLKADPCRGLTAILRFVGCEPDAAAVATAVAHTSFAAMQQREAQGGSAVRALSAFDPENPASFKARRGEVGGYVAYFASSELGRIDATVAAQLSPRLQVIIRDAAVAITLSTGQRDRT